MRISAIVKMGKELMKTVVPSRGAPGGSCRYLSFHSALHGDSQVGLMLFYRAIAILEIMVASAHRGPII